MSTETPTWKRHLTKALTILLIFMVCLSILQWFIIKVLFDFGTEMLKDAMVRQAPEGVNRNDIISTFERVKSAAQQLPFSFITGRINLRKIKEAGEFAIEASTDETWDAEEINTLLWMLNASVGYKQGLSN
jgi:cell division protein YceG involved in septum cleavage